MSYYMGDYYRGDPGIGSFLGGLARKAVGFIPGVGPAISSAIEMFGGRAAGKVAQTPAAAGISQAAGSAIRTVKGAIVKHPVITAAAGAGAMMGAGAVAERMITGGQCGVRGHSQRRPLKHCGQVLKSGKCGKCYRSMNVCNPRALRRAIRRTRGFAKLAMKTIHIVHPKKKGRFGGFKRRRKS